MKKVLIGIAVGIVVLVAGVLTVASMQPGTFRLVFDTAAYFAASEQSSFFPEVSISFTLADPSQHYHVPVLLSPFAYSTYRGS